MNPQSRGRGRGVFGRGYGCECCKNTQNIILPCVGGSGTVFAIKTSESTGTNLESSGNPLLGIRNPLDGIKNPPVIHCQESRIH